MNKNTNLIYALSLIFGTCSMLYSDIDTADAMHTIQSLDAVASTPDETKISFNYVNEDIVNVVNYIASLSGKNILLPQGSQALKIKLSYEDTEKLSLQEAWNFLVSFLNMAGYSVIEKHGTHQIIKTYKEIARDGLPVYIGQAINSAPQADELIVYIHYFSNIKVSQEGSSELSEIIKATLPDETKYEVDANRNALVIAGKTRDIRGLLEIIEQLDKAGFKEKLDIIKLQYASARIVADLFNDNILQQQDTFNRYRLDTRKKADSTYFSSKTRIIADERINAIIVIGHEQAVERLKEFIKHYIDIELESGKSVLHVYHLQYLDAQEFAPILEKIVKSNDIGSSGQARGSGGKTAGPERFFDDVIIAYDKPDNAEDLKYYGGNNLIIACRNDDWSHIKRIIEELDTPKTQVFIEVLIADLTLEDSRLLGSLTRNPDKIPIINLTQFQSAQLDPGVVVDGVTVNDKFVPTSISGDMLPLTATGSGSDEKTTNLTIENMNALSRGSTVISLNDNDGKTWSILQILNLFTHSKILSHPHLVATNGKKSIMEIGQERLVTGDVSGSIGSNTVLKKEPYTAKLTLNITPRISSADTVNLDVSIEIEEFLDTSDNSPKTTRSVKTNANISTDSILTLGGLIRSNTQQGEKQTPGLGDIPVLGWFFKNKSGNVTKNNLTVFISPTIVQPRLRKGIGRYTQDYINLAERYADESVLFDSLKDPITRLFFRTDETFDRALDDFIDEDQFVLQETIVPEPAPRNTSSHARASKPQIKQENQEATLAGILQHEQNPFTNAKQEIAPEKTTIALEFEDNEKNALLKELLKEEKNPFL